MIQTNPLYSKESLKKATSRLSWDSRILIYDGSDDGSNHDIQQKAGKELRQCLWIIAVIMDHIFDYYPFSYFVAKEEQQDASEYCQWFKTHPSVAVRNAIHYANNNFTVLQTVTRNNLNQHRVPRRNLDEEEHVITVLCSIDENLDEITELLKAPRKVLDLSKPSADEIKMLITSIKKISKLCWDNAKRLGKTGEETWRLSMMYELFLNPLYLAWQVYNYGWHSDFWEEGDSMWEFMSYEVDVETTTNEFISLLETNSPFVLFEHNCEITDGLLKVYRHLLTQNWRDKI